MRYQLVVFRILGHLMPFLGVVGARLVSGGDRLGLRVGHRVSLRALGPWGAPSPHPNALAHHTEAALKRPFFRGPLVQEEAIPDRKLKYFSSKNPATSACFWRFLGSTGRTRNGGRVCWGRPRRPVLGGAPPGGVLSNGKVSA